MARRDGRPRPTPDDQLRPNTLDRYLREIRRYERDSALAAIDAREPPVDWLVRYLVRLAQSSPKQLGNQIAALAYYFRMHHRPDITVNARVRQLLREPSAAALDPLTMDVGPLEDVLTHERAKARAYAENAFRPETREAYARCAQAWEIYACACEIDAKRPLARQVANYLCEKACDERFGTIKHRRNAISWYFRASGVPDMTLADEVVHALDGLKRSIGGPAYKPLYSEDLRIMCMSLGAQPMDVRDRCICLLRYFGPFNNARLHRLSWEMLTFQADGITIRKGKRNIFVGGVNDAEIDVRVWFTCWKAIVRREAGPVFVSFDRSDRSWLNARMSTEGIRRVLWRAAARAGLRPQCVGWALQKGFIRRAASVHGAAVTMAYLGYRTICGLRNYYPEIAILERRIRRNARNSRSFDY